MVVNVNESKKSLEDPQLKTVFPFDKVSSEPTCEKGSTSSTAGVKCSRGTFHLSIAAGCVIVTLLIICIALLAFTAASHQLCKLKLNRCKNDTVFTEAVSHRPSSFAFALNEETNDEEIEEDSEGLMNEALEHIAATLDGCYQPNSMDVRQLNVSCLKKSLLGVCGRDIRRLIAWKNFNGRS